MREALPSDVAHTVAKTVIELGRHQSLRLSGSVADITKVFTAMTKPARWRSGPDAARRALQR
ncbi:hypothetical protein A5625_10995 [Mycobacterium sp. 1465703.0]|nr:hypothetical protein A5625_10995 [Mycobacterium sp. 1465703.0]